MTLQVSTLMAIVVAFVVQVIVGSLLFLALYAVAVALSLIIHGLNEMIGESAAWLATASRYAEMGLFGADLVAFALFVVSEVVKFARSLWQEGAVSHGSN